jgi:hypothetical protein
MLLWTVAGQQYSKAGNAPKLSSCSHQTSMSSAAVVPGLAGSSPEHFTVTLHSPLSLPTQEDPQKGDCSCHL